MRGNRRGTLEEVNRRGSTVREDTRFAMVHIIPVIGHCLHDWPRASTIPLSARMPPSSMAYEALQRIQGVFQIHIAANEIEVPLLSCGNVQ